ncbi:MAG: hypothetical protein M1497_16155 [Nitrospirae bacterium]|nr:hypothetical protein [Nitrospirota bacterium]
MEERRCQKRFSVGRSDIVGKMTSSSEVKLIDIGIGGISLKADRRLEIGRKYSLQLGYRDNVALSLDGIAVWSILSERSEKPLGAPIYEAGMQFDCLLADKRNKITDLIHSCKLEEVHKISAHRLNPNSAPACRLLLTNAGVCFTIYTRKGGFLWRDAQQNIRHRA